MHRNTPQTTCSVQTNIQEVLVNCCAQNMYLREIRNTNRFRSTFCRYFYQAISVKSLPS